MRKRKDDKKKTFQTLVLVSQLGLVMMASIGMTCALGVWLDKKFGTNYITVIMFVIGVLAGFKSVYRMVMQIYGDEEECDDRKDKKDR